MSLVSQTREKTRATNRQPSSSAALAGFGQQGEGAQKREQGGEPHNFLFSPGLSIERTGENFPEIPQLLHTTGLMPQSAVISFGIILLKLGDCKSQVKKARLLGKILFFFFPLFGKILIKETSAYSLNQFINGARSLHTISLG